MTGPLTKSLSRSVFSPDRRRGTSGTAPVDSVLPFKGMGLLARLGFCRRPFSDDEGEVTIPPKPAPALPEPYVRVRIKVLLIMAFPVLSSWCRTQSLRLGVLHRGSCSLAVGVVSLASCSTGQNLHMLLIFQVTNLPPSLLPECMHLTIHMLSIPGLGCQPNTCNAPAIFDSGSTRAAAALQHTLCCSHM